MSELYLWKNPLIPIEQRLELAVIEIDKLRAAANALLHQIDIGDFTDSNGHAAQMLKATHDLMRVLGA